MSYFFLVNINLTIRDLFLLLGLPFASALSHGGWLFCWLPVLLLFFMLFGLPSALLLLLGLLYRCSVSRFSFLIFCLTSWPAFLACLLLFLVAEVRDLRIYYLYSRVTQTVWFSAWSAPHRFQRQD